MVYDTALELYFMGRVLKKMYLFDLHFKISDGPEASTLGKKLPRSSKYAFTTELSCLECTKHCLSYRIGVVELGVWGIRAQKKNFLAVRGGM